MAPASHHAPGSRGVVTELLHRAQAGDPVAHHDVFQALRAPLRAMAVRQMRRHPHRLLWQPTAVVDDTWCRLMAMDRTRWADRNHFLRVAATVVYRIVIDWARRELAHKRRSGPVVELPADGGEDRARVSPGDLLDLDAALARLDARSPRLVEVVRMRAFGGYRMADIAAALGVGLSTVEADWQLARTLLHEMLQG